MSKTKLDRYRRQLETLRRRLRGDATGVTEQAMGPCGGQAAGELTNVPQHLGDMAAEEIQHDLSAVLVENEEYLMGEVHAALARLDDGVFGKCEACGAKLPKERLDALPFARFCVACADAQHQGADVDLNAGRPRSPADTLAPEGAMQEDWRPVASAFESSKRNAVATDNHAAGTAGGGTALGGLAGTNAGHGDPMVSDLQDAAGSGNFDVDESRDQSQTPRAGRRGGATGGTPAAKRPK